MTDSDREQTQRDFVAGLAGNKRAYERALTALADVVRRTVRKRIWTSIDDADVEDIVQTVLVAIHEKRATYETGLPLMAWVSGITKYKILQYLRSNRRYRAVLTDKDWDSFVETISVPDEQDPFTRHDIQTMLATLSPEQRQAVTLTKIEGLSVQDAAERADVTLSAMKVRIHRAMEKLKTQAKEL